MDSTGIPSKGSWPVDPQDDVPISKDRIWIDGCFDFSHHGHAGAMLQARRLGKELIVGVHSDEDIMDNKGPTVMTLKERISAVDACRWSSASVPCAPYVTSLPWISHYGCRYVVHGDDITSDSSGQDCYRFVKAAGRFLVVKRTPGISTTDLVGRMLLYTRDHHVKSLTALLAGEEGPGSTEERQARGQDLKQRIMDFASDDTGLAPGCEVWECSTVKDDSDARDRRYRFTKLVAGHGPKEGQRVVYVDGGFDLFSSGHIKFLQLVHQAEEELAKTRNWDDEAQRQARLQKSGQDYRPAYVVAGIHDDETVHDWKGVGHPIMNIIERGLCVLQCKYIDAIIFSAPFIPSKSFLTCFPYGMPRAVYHGPTSFVTTQSDVYADAKEMGLFRQIGPHESARINAEEIVQRVLINRKRYEERQRAKGVKAFAEDELKRGEKGEVP